jgi:serine/threonine protein kinase
MKLTDSGSGQSSSVEDGPDLAGSPYWMAPEIIEMSTPTSACDIWCVEFRIATIGCH